MKEVGASFHNSKAASDYFPQMQIGSRTPLHKISYIMKILEVKIAQWKSLRSEISLDPIRIGKMSGSGNPWMLRSGKQGEYVRKMSYIFGIYLGIRLGHTKRSDVSPDRGFVWCSSLMFYVHLHMHVSRKASKNIRGVCLFLNAYSTCTAKWLIHQVYCPQISTDVIKVWALGGGNKSIHWGLQILMLQCP